ncbi:hypothetical protein EUTSA_v10015532mg [Eutrema salsugineum]|uniref:Uncharacterized protein n=1 Tax=Eutrema salsugineum TaxID=72664 RepID=V4LG39_EUTSA|nr:hypothetical protein EUTSA_v10015532mg [Eutrema salsugineum]
MSSTHFFVQIQKLLFVLIPHFLSLSTKISLIILILRAKNYIINQRDHKLREKNEEGKISIKIKYKN